MKRSGPVALIVLLWLGIGAPAEAWANDALTRALTELNAKIPTDVNEYSRDSASAADAAARDVQTAAAQCGQLIVSPEPTDPVAQVLELVDAKHQVDRLLRATLARRTEFATLAADPRRVERASAFLSICSRLIDLSGRLRYQLFDSLHATVSQREQNPASIRALLSGLAARKSSIGAVVLTNRFLIPPSRQSGAGSPLGASDAASLLRMIASTGDTELLPHVADFVFDEATPPELVVQAAETIRYLGMPQEPLPGQDPTLPEPTVLADELYDRLQNLPLLRLSRESRQRRANLYAWLETCMRLGEAGPSYRWGASDVRPGDWFLMRNPSPYNLFTDLSPGLFTHVGIVTDYRGDDGIRRFVLVDLPERGTTMQTTNYDTFVQRTLHFIVLRHEDPQVAAAMAAAARSMIGNPTQFDLNFRTDRIESLRGQPLAGKKIHTYCAGLLLLCAMQSSAPRADFFPLPEHPAGGNTVTNLARLGLSFGENFVSPTGALFAPKMQIVGTRHSMYDPTREIQEVVYDHFAQQLKDRRLNPSPDLYQSVRLALAEAAQQNPLLARAMASAAKVSTDSDLVAAAKAAAVVETLDQIAFDARDGFTGARMAIRAGDEATLRSTGYEDEAIAAILAYRSRHNALYDRWRAGQLSPRELRVELVKYYASYGAERLDQRFFSDPE